MPLPPLRPVYHRKEQRIGAHVILCWLALLLARIAENACHAAWPQIRRELDRIHVGTFTAPAGTFGQRTEITKARRDILARLATDPPRGSASSPHPAPDQHQHPALDTRRKRALAVPARALPGVTWPAAAAVCLRLVCRVLAWCRDGPGPVI